MDLNAAFVFDQSLTIIGGDYAYAYYTYNGYVYNGPTSNINKSAWQTITVPYNNVSIAQNYSIKSIYVSQTKRVFFGIDVSGGNSLIYSFSIPTDAFGADVSGGFSSSSSSTDSSLNLPYPGIKSMDGRGNILWVTVGKNISRIDISSNTYTTSHTNTVGDYKSIYVLDQSNIAAAGNNIISFSTNGGTNWTDLSLNIPIINRISLFDTSNAIAVCNS